MTQMIARVRPVITVVTKRVIDRGPVTTVVTPMIALVRPVITVVIKHVISPGR